MKILIISDGQFGDRAADHIFNKFHDVNKNVIMPSSMCSLEPNTGIKMIDEFLSHFGKPIYQITVDKVNQIFGQTWTFYLGSPPHNRQNTLNPT